MSALVFVEIDEGQVKKSSLEAVSYAAAVDSEVVAIVFAKLTEEESLKLGKAGAKKLLLVSDSKFAASNIMAYSSAIAEAMGHESSSLLVTAKSSLADPVSARVAIKTGASLASNVSELVDVSNGFSVKTSIYTGKAFASSKLTAEKKILVIKKNAIEISESGSAPEVTDFQPTINDIDFKVKITSTDKTTGEVLLPEADIVVSGGRGLKGQKTGV